MTRYNGSGWHHQSVRHSNARKYGKAGGTYATQMTITHSEPKPQQRYMQVAIYKFDELPANLKEKVLNNYRYINVDDDEWWANDDFLFEPSKEDFKRLGKGFKREYNKATKDGYTTLNHFKIEAFDLERENYLQIKDIDTKSQDTFLKQIGLTESQIKKIYDLGINNERENDSEIKLYFNDDVSDTERGIIYEHAQEGFSNLIHEARKRLRQTLDDDTSDKGVTETLRINEYDFNEQGKIA
jgi:hypothetical protein